MLLIWVKDRWDFPREEFDNEIGKYWSLGYGGSDKKNLNTVESGLVGERKNESKPELNLSRRNLAVTWGA